MVRLSSSLLLLLPINLYSLLLHYTNTRTHTHAANRTDPSPEDVAYAFKDMEISIPDLLTYARLVDSTPLPPLHPYPLPSRSAHIYSRPSTPVMKPRPSLSEEDEEGEDEDIIPSYFPPLPSKADDDKGIYSVIHVLIDHVTIT